MALFRNKKKKEDFKKVEPQEEQVVEENPMQEIVQETVQEQEQQVAQVQPKEQPQEKQEEKPKETIQVVDELPTQVVRRAKTEDGTIVTYVTIAEALTELINEEEE